MSKNQQVPPRLLSQLPPGLILENEYEKNPEKMISYEMPISVLNKLPKDPPPALPPSGSQSTLHESFYEYLEQPCQASKKRSTLSLLCTQNCIWGLVIFNVLFISLGATAYFYLHQGAFQKDSEPQKPRTCSNGYTFFDETGMCYRASETMLNYRDAEKNCHWEHAQLVSIHSAAENSFVVELAKHALQRSGNVWEYRYRTWTGLTHQNGQFQWSDGSKFDWHNWQSTNVDMKELEKLGTTMLLETSQPTKVEHNKWINEPPEFGNVFVCKKAAI